ncbi:hypothetical protein [Geothrix sp. 21YS21S-2]|uniref:hypothetical protein n=1 Tax=Geothrix sp. 21YS21S-2 TaxID=3068893 RepID=UPI0027B88B8F|nr:hypothetical protein [Geothrix sp. 21YS21S-2]
MAQSEFLTKATLLKIGFTNSQATDLAAAHITAQQLGAAVITHEHRGETDRAGGDASGVQAGIIALMNRTISEGWKNFNDGEARAAVSQEGLSASSNTLLQALTAKHQFDSLTGPGNKSNRGFISDLLLGGTQIQDTHMQ